MYIKVELDETAKNRELDKVRERYFDDDHDLDFEKANETKCKIMELADVVLLDYGYGYANPRAYYNGICNIPLEEKFAIFKDKVKNNFLVNNKFDSIMKDIIDKWDFNREIYMGVDYLETIGYIIIEFDKAVTALHNMIKCN